MTRHESVAGLPACAGRVSPWLWGPLGALTLVLAGCSQTSLSRAKSADDAELRRYDVPLVGDRTVVGNAEPITLGGVGLVEGLEGTGGDCPHDSYRAMLADELRKKGVQNVSAVLNSPDCALVIVEALFPPGAAKGDPIDLEVKLPPGSRATSLRGGVLRKCFLRNYDFARNLKPDYNGPANVLPGNKVAVAEGPVLVGSGDGEESERVKRGRIWQGGRCLVDYPLALVMKPDSQQGRFTALISERVNSTFQGGLRGALDSRLAHTGDNISVALRVPPQYRYNLPHFLRVVRAVPLTEGADATPRQGDDRRSYRQKLGEDLLDPARAIVAAIRLEALGERSVPLLKKGLASQHPLVRFASAQGLAYLGSPAGCEELGKIIVEYPVLRSHALAALAALDEAASQLALKNIVLGDLDDEARYGAFRALHTLNPRDPVVRGDKFNDSFWLHRVAARQRPLVHVSTTRRAEIVLFGETPTLRPPFSFLAGEFAVTATEDSATAAISRVPLHGKPLRKSSSLELEEVIRAMADLGAGYPEVLAVLQQASSCDSLSCRVRVDALPQASSAQELAELGKDASGKELLPAGAGEMAATPTLFQLGVPSSKLEVAAKQKEAEGADQRQATGRP
jgi:hypothetical protein